MKKIVINIVSIVLAWIILAPILFMEKFNCLFYSKCEVLYVGTLFLSIGIYLAIFWPKHFTFEEIGPLVICMPYPAGGLWISMLFILKLFTKCDIADKNWGPQ